MNNPTTKAITNNINNLIINQMLGFNYAEKSTILWCRLAIHINYVKHLDGDVSSRHNLNKETTVKILGIGICFAILWRNIANWTSSIC